MTSKTTGGVLLNIPVTASTNRMSGATYDVAGNVTQDGVHTFSYDPFGQPRKMSESGGQVMDAIYDADGERIGLVNEGSGDWKWTPRDLSGKVAREYLARNGSVSDPTQFLYVWKEDYAYRDGVLAGSMREFAEGGRRFFHLDHLGTPRVTTNVDGQVISQNDYYPFGQEITSMRQEIVQGYDRDEPMKFTGHERDFIGGTYVENSDNLDYMHAREYNAGLGRLMSVDPILVEKVAMTNPQSWNRYTYVQGNPLRWTDPTGKVIVYDASFRKRLKNDATFRRAFEAWKATRSGKAQWNAMARDTDTKYRLIVGKVIYQPSLLSDKFEANGMTLPFPHGADQNKYGQLNSAVTESTINADRMEGAGALTTQARVIAGALFEEVAHALDLGSESRTEWGAWKAEEGFHAEPITEPRWIQFQRELSLLIPPEE